ncbi:MAG TPA: GH1 family beta-glucosidase [Pseudonocardiaceae bacterium]|jgi:beta-glucosidase
MSEPLPAFPAGFLWGTATAAYQIEGAVDEDGRGRSVWDTFCAQPGRVANGDNGEIACDHYHRWAEDVALMAELGAGGYRFSIAWPRIQPDGRGPVNPHGVAFYDRLVDALCELRIVPMATLFHWDTPQPIEDAGGWLARDTAERFAEYAAVVADALSDRVQHWITLNEPIVHLLCGYATGVHAPGHALLTGALPLAHTLLLGHGLAVQALRARGAQSVGITNNYSPAWPATGAPADLAAAAAFDGLYNRLFTEPLLLGAYPDGLRQAFPETTALPELADADREAITAPIDFLGVNYYFPTRLAAPAEDAPLPFELTPIQGYPTTSFGWPVVPEGLHHLLVGLAERYGEQLPPIHITENGCSYDDAPGPTGAVHDPDRIAFLDTHLRAMHSAISAGVDVRGYFVWSLLDNFEWAEGYAKRFGLVHVDFETQVRTPKSSFHWYRDVITATG